jgi:hypothetical protein
MTRRLLALLAGTLLTGSAAAIAPPRTVEAALVPARPTRTPAAAPPAVDVFLGDGVFRLRIRTCHGCDTSITFEVRLTAP